MLSFKAVLRLYKATRQLRRFRTFTEPNYSVVPGALVCCSGGVRLVSPILEVKHVTPLSKAPLTWREREREMRLVLASACMHAALCVCVPLFPLYSVCVSRASVYLCFRAHIIIRFF